MISRLHIEALLEHCLHQSDGMLAPWIRVHQAKMQLILQYFHMLQRGGDHTGGGCHGQKMVVVESLPSPVPSSPQEECGEVNAEVDNKKMVGESPPWVCAVHPVQSVFLDTLWHGAGLVRLHHPPPSSPCHPQSTTPVGTATSNVGTTGESRSCPRVLCDRLILQLFCAKWIHVTFVTF